MFGDVFQGRCSYKFRNIHRKTFALEPLFNKVADPQGSNVIKKRPQCRCFPVNIANVFRTAFLIAFLVAA